jgi:putative tricarboxylic transport membrane protein
MSGFALAAFSNIFQLENLLFMFIGVASGILIGCLPGLTATMALAVLVPFTFTMDAASAFIVLGAVYVGAIYGGSISAILVNTPGTPSAIATTFDGFPLAKKGLAENALVAAAFSSGVGGIIGNICLLLFSPILATFALQFGPPEYFWLGIFGLTIITTLSSKSILKGLIGGTLGILISTVGMSPLGGDVRFTFGIPALQAGIELIVALIGFFCIPEIFFMIEKRTERYKVSEYKRNKGVVRQVIISLIRKPIMMVRSSLIGTIIGMIPAAGGNIAGMVSYNETVRFSKEKDTFGKGNIEGVASSETSNNAAVSGSLVPLLTLGIPGSPPAAILLGALMLQGMRPGPELYSAHGTVTYTFIFSIFLSNILMVVLGIYGAKYYARLINIPVNYLAPMIVFLTVVGSFAIRRNMVDVYLMVALGFIGYLTRKAGFHPGPITLGLILGPIAETGYVQSMLISKAEGGIFLLFLSRPITVFLIILSVITVFVPLWIEYRGRRKSLAERDKKRDD